MSDRIFTYFDLETTGLSTKVDTITQIGATIVYCDSHGKRTLLSNYQTLVKTNRQIHPEASKVTGITNHSLRHAPITSKALSLFIFHLRYVSMAWNYLKEHPVESKKSIEDQICTLLDSKDNPLKGYKTDLLPMTLVAYNGMKFDFPILYREMCRWGIVPAIQFRLCNLDYFLDPIIWAKSNVPSQYLKKNLKTMKPSYKLGDIYESLLGSTLDGAHDALVDTIGLEKVCGHNQFSGMSIGEFNYCMSNKNYCGYLKLKLYNENKVKRKKGFRAIRKLIDCKQPTKRKHDDNTERGTKRRKKN